MSFGRKTIKLIYWLIGAYEENEMRHPSIVLKELGISYKEYIGQPIADQIQLFGCSNVPDKLPPYIEVFLNEDD